ncbi:MAG: prolipoprotein diacylglyceryl transferase [Nitriliruptorales bacterium]|nr:prolipoprotein diacylglyceryl transferase [Nitriliruptorales bacterium]
MYASIPSPPTNVLEVGPLEIHYYGILIAIGIAVALTWVRRRYERFGGDPDLVDRVLVWAVVAGFVGARLAYASTHLHRFEGRPEAILFVWEGGLAFFGGLTFGAITAAVLVLRWTDGGRYGDLPRFVDAAAPGVPLAQAIGRWGNYFNQELFGTPSDLPWAVEIDPANRPEQYQEAATFHPTFLYESLYNLVVVAILLTVEKRADLRRGSLLFVYLILYGIGRFLLELIRTDTTFRLLGISRNGWVSILAIIAGVLALRWWQQRARAAGVRHEEDNDTSPAVGTASAPSSTDDRTPDSTSEGR